MSVHNLSCNFSYPGICNAHSQVELGLDFSPFISNSMPIIIIIIVIHTYIHTYKFISYYMRGIILSSKYLLRIIKYSRLWVFLLIYSHINSPFYRQGNWGTNSTILSDSETPRYPQETPGVSFRPTYHWTRPCSLYCPAKLVGKNSERDSLEPLASSGKFHTNLSNPSHSPTINMMYINYSLDGGRTSKNN